jgi:hypothetical protein
MSAASSVRSLAQAMHRAGGIDDKRLAEFEKMCADVEATDAMAPALRALVHEYDLAQVQSAMKLLASEDPALIEGFLIKNRRRKTPKP